MKSILTLFRDQWRLYQANLSVALLLELLGLVVSYIWLLTHGDELGFTVTMILANMLALLMVAMSQRPATMALTDRLLPVRRGTLWCVEFFSGIAAAATVTGFAFIAVYLAQQLPGLEKIADAWILQRHPAILPAVGIWLAGCAFLVAALISFPTLWQRVAGIPLLLLTAAGIIAGIFEMTAWLADDRPGITWFAVLCLGAAAAAFAAARYTGRYRDRKAGGWRWLTFAAAAALLFGVAGAATGAYIFEQLGNAEKHRIRQWLKLPEPGPKMSRTEAKYLAERLTEAGTRYLFGSPVPEVYFTGLAELLKDHAPMPFVLDWNYYYPGFNLRHCLFKAQTDEEIEVIFPIYRSWITDNENWFAECFDSAYQSIYLDRRKRRLQLTLEQNRLLWDKFLTLEPLCRNTRTDLEWFFPIPDPGTRYFEWYSEVLPISLPPLPHEKYLQWHTMRLDLERTGKSSETYFRVRAALDSVWRDYLRTMMLLYLNEYYLTHDGQYPRTLDSSTLPPVLRPPDYEWWLPPAQDNILLITLREVAK